MGEIKVNKVWLTESAVWVLTEDGREACEMFDDYPRLRCATKEQRADYTIDSFGIRWDALDEDLSFEGFFREKHSNPLYDLFMEHSELNASAIARRMGISQSLFARYISGAKRPSPVRMNEILETIRTIGKELSAIGGL